MVWLLIYEILVGLLLTIPASLARVAGPTMNQLFGIDSTCTGMDLDAILDDARTLLAAARTGIAALQEASNFPLASSTLHNYMRNAHNQFGTTYYTDWANTGLNSVDRAKLAQVDGRRE